MKPLIFEIEADELLLYAPNIQFALAFVEREYKRGATHFTLTQRLAP